MQGAISWSLIFQIQETATWDRARRRWDHLSHVSRMDCDPGREKENTWCVTRNNNREKSDLASHSIAERGQVKGVRHWYMDEQLGASICYLDGHDDIVLLIQSYSRGSCLLVLLVLIYNSQAYLQNLK